MAIIVQCQPATADPNTSGPYRRVTAPWIVANPQAIANSPQNNSGANAANAEYSAACPKTEVHGFATHSPHTTVYTPSMITAAVLIGNRRACANFSGASLIVTNH